MGVNLKTKKTIEFFNDQNPRFVILFKYRFDKLIALPMRREHW